MDSVFLEDSSGTRTQLWPIAGDLPVGLIQETKTYRIEALGIENPRNTRMFIGDEELESLMPRAENSCLWKWQPGYHAGSLDARINEPGYRETRISLVTDPSLDKLSRFEFCTMLQEIMEDSFSLFSIGNFKTSLGSDKRNRPPEIGRLQYIEQRIDALDKVLREIERRPQRTLHGRSQIVRLGESSRISGNDILKSFRSGNLTKVTSRLVAVSALRDNLLPRRVSVEKKVQLSDTKENREIKYCLARWQFWLTKADSSLIKAINRRRNQSQDIESSDVYEVYRIKIQRMQRKLRELDKLEFLRDLKPTLKPPKLSSVYQRDVAYRKFYKLHREFNWGIARVFGEFLQVPLARTFDLYEMWCFYRILRVSIKLYGIRDEQLFMVFDPDTSSQDIVVRSGSVELELLNGFRLGFKRQFREYWLENDGLGSFSRTMEPDIYFSVPDRERV